MELAHLNTVTKSETCGAFGEMELSMESSNPNSSQADGRKHDETTVKYREEDKFLPKQHKTIDIGDDDDLPGMVYKTTTVAPSECTSSLLSQPHPPIPINQPSNLSLVYFKRLISFEIKI